MAYREVYRVQVLEVIRRWQLGESQRSIARATGLSRNTVEKYVRAAVAAGVSQGGSAPEESLLASLLRNNQPGPSPASSLAPLAVILEGQREQIAVWLSQEHLQLTHVHELLLQQGVAVSYTTLRRFVRHAGLGKAARSTVRLVGWPPGGGGGDGLRSPGPADRCHR